MEQSLVKQIKKEVERREEHHNGLINPFNRYVSVGHEIAALECNRILGIIDQYERNCKWEND